jgi:hypothetical protein
MLMLMLKLQLQVGGTGYRLTYRRLLNNCSTEYGHMFKLLGIFLILANDRRKHPSLVTCLKNRLLPTTYTYVAKNNRSV